MMFPPIAQLAATAMALGSRLSAFGQTESWRWLFWPIAESRTPIAVAATNLVPDIGTMLINWLAVAGGVAVGALGTGWLVQGLSRLTMHRPAPRGVVRVVRILGGAALGLAIYLLIFGSGGGGFGLGGGGWGLGGRGGGTDKEGSATTTGPAGTHRERPGTAPATPREPGEVLRVEMLGGKRYPGAERYYLLPGDAAPHTLFEVRQAIDARKQQAPLKEVDILIREEGSVAEAHAAVKDLKELASSLGLSVKVTSVPGGPS